MWYKCVVSDNEKNVAIYVKSRVCTIWKFAFVGERTVTLLKKMKAALGQFMA
jgi:hypothetical protein